MTADASTLSPWQRTRFALGDLAFNFYWQSITLYLLFYYTDIAALPIASAALLYMLPSIWDGVVDFAVGLFADRLGAGRGGYRRFLVLGAVPLGAAFVLLYLPLPFAGTLLFGGMLVAHVLFRTLYAVVNVPYSALTARITTSSRDRTSIAGLRMVFGTVAAVIVALVTQPLATLSGGQGNQPLGYFTVALILAAAGTAVLLPVALSVREHVPDKPTPAAIGAFLRDCLRTLAGNRAFLSLMAAMIAMTFAATIFGKSILYYFKYVVGQEAAGREVLAVMGVAGGLAVPLWMAIGRRFGARIVWLASAALAVVVATVVAVADLRSALIMQGYFVTLQVAIMGMHFAFWSLLPDTIEYGEHNSGQRFEATTFGLAAFVQKIAFGAAGGLFGMLFAAIGYQANVAQAPATLAGMRSIVLAAPAIGLALSALCIALNPLRQHVHDAIVDDLERRRGDAALAAHEP